MLAYIKSKIDKAGYMLQIFEMSPHNYGIPQQRERIYFVCVRKDIYNGEPIQLQSYNGPQLNFQHFLQKPEEIDDKYKLNGDILNVLNAWEEMIKIFKEGERISPTILIHDAYRTYTDEEFQNLAPWRKDYMTRNKPLIEKYQTQFDGWYERHKELLSKREIYGKLE